MITTDSLELNVPEKITAAKRLVAIDVLRGLVMVIMALDHVRDLWSLMPFRAEDVTQTSPMWFFTRWITHLCAPIFVFLSGVSIFLYARQADDLKSVSKYLLTRGLWLVFLEVTLLSFSLQFGYNLTLLAVIWAIGCSMILMSALIWVPRSYLIAITAIVLAGHNLIPTFQPQTASEVVLGMLRNSPFIFQIGPLPVLVSYSIVPWSAVMLFGYLIGQWFTRPEREQRSLFLLGGVVLLILFFLLRGINIYGDPAPWAPQTRGFVYTVLSFFNVSKYPPSLMFVCMTLGLGMMLIALFTSVHNKFTKALEVYGRVPLFYYAVHMPLIVAGAYVWTYLAFGKVTNLAFANSSQFPEGYEPSIARTYVVWICVVALLYLPCKWYGDYKRKRSNKWLTYL